MWDYAFGMWWTDLFGGTYHDDKIIDLLAQLKSIDNRYLGSAGAAHARDQCIDRGHYNEVRGSRHLQDDTGR